MQQRVEIIELFYYNRFKKIFTINIIVEDFNEVVQWKIEEKKK